MVIAPREGEHHAIDGVDVQRTAQAGGVFAHPHVGLGAQPLSQAGGPVHVFAYDEQS